MGVIPRVLSFSFLLLLGFTCCRPAFAQKQSEEKTGAILFRDKGCTYCHGQGGVGTKKAPSLTELWKDRVWTPEKITNQILNGGQKMPPFRESVTDEDVNNLIAYLRSKNKPVPPPVETEDSTPAPSPQQ
jgi:mono/diheme cytochrome c family protein